MERTEPLVRDISDTARWIAIYRALESERPHPLFRDPYARLLAGERGAKIAETMGFATRNAWAWATRTYLIDHLIAEQVEEGADMVVNLGAGLDTRPYRMDLPPSLTWVEIDKPEILAYKEDLLAMEAPRCIVERVRLDLSDVTARRDLFDRLGRSSEKAVIVTEGFTVYLSEEEVISLASNLGQPPSFQSWILDLASARGLRIVQKNMGKALEQAGAPLKFGPVEGPEFFTQTCWSPALVCSVFRAAAELKRLPWWMQMLAKLPEPKGPVGNRAWSGVCLLEKV